MIRNPDKSRGEIVANIGGADRILCLTLGALAEIEARLGPKFVGIGRGVAEHTLAARDLIAILGAALRGGGNPITDDELAGMTFLGGASAAADLCDELFDATFPETAWLDHDGIGCPYDGGVIIELENGDRLPASHINWQRRFRYRLVDGEKR